VKQTGSHGKESTFNNRGTVGNSVSYVAHVKRFINGKNLEYSSLVKRWPAANGVSAEVEGSPLLEAVTR
jgi:hypothetical protein